MSRASADGGWRSGVYGAVPRVEAQAAHERFLEVVRPRCVLLSVVHARRLVKRGVSAGEWAPAGTWVGTTSTVADGQLARWGRERELEVVEGFRPAFHVPADYPVYADDPVEEQRAAAARCGRGTMWMADRAPAATSIVPLVKGSSPAVRRVSERVIVELEPSAAAVYATQYFTASGGGGWPALRQDLEAVRRETSGYPVVVIGLLSPALLREAPGNVVGAAGVRQWREAVRPRSNSERGMQRAYGRLAAAVEAAVGPGSTPAHSGTEPRGEV